MGIRLATVDDIGPLVHLTGNFFRATAYGKMLPIDEDYLERYVQAVIEQGIIFVGVRNFALVGFLAGIRGRHPITGEIFAEEVGWWVEPSARSTLLGYKLLRSFEDWARQNGAVLVKMVAPWEAHGVGEFYVRAGYTQLETAFVEEVLMAGFTTALIIGLAVGGAFAGGSAVAKKKAANAAKDQAAAPGPTDATTLAAPPTPPSQTVSSSASVGSALQVAAKQRRKASPRSNLGLPSGSSPASAITQPKTLVGY